MSKTSPLRRGIFSATGIVIAAIAAVVIAALILLPLPRLSLAAPQFELTPAAAHQQRVCQGPVVQTTSSANDATTFLSVGETETLVAPDDGNVVSTNLSAVDNAAPAFLGLPSVLTLAEGTDPETASLAGLQSQSIMSDQMYGLAAAACTDPSNDVWLVGGATDVGRTTVLMLANPSSVTATVTVEVLAEHGRVETPTTGSTAGIVVQPGEQRLVSLAGYAPDVYAPAVHVVSTGGQVLATLQQSVMRTLVPAGVDFINPSAEPNTVQYISGVVLTGQAAHDDGEHGAVMSDLESTVRVANPGTTEAQVKVQFISDTGQTQEVSSTIKAQSTVQFPFAGVKDGTYTVIVTGDVPLVAGVRTIQDMQSGGGSSSSASPSATATGKPTATPTPTATASQAPASPSDAAGGFNNQPGGGSGNAASTANLNDTSFGGDFTWYSSSRTLGNATVLVVPNVATAIAAFYNPTPETLTVTLTPASGSSINVTVPSGTMAVTQLDASTIYYATGTAGLLGGMSFSGKGLGAAVALNPDNGFGSAVRVYPR